MGSECSTVVVSWGMGGGVLYREGSILIIWYPPSSHSAVASSCRIHPTPLLLSAPSPEAGAVGCHPVHCVRPARLPCEVSSGRAPDSGMDGDGVAGTVGGAGGDTAVVDLSRCISTKEEDAVERGGMPLLLELLHLGRCFLVSLLAWSYGPIEPSLPPQEDL